MIPRLVLTAALRRALFYEAERTAPEECCGVLLGRTEPSGARVLTLIIPATNVAAGDRRLAYTIDPRALLVAERWSEHGLSVLGVYHSHPDAAPILSASDRDGRVGGWSYLIIGISTRPRLPPPTTQGEPTTPCIRSHRCVADDFVAEEVVYEVKGGGEDRSQEA
jgi:proteasome lid subunit RPN8/RPN11